MDIELLQSLKDHVSKSAHTKLLLADETASLLEKIAGQFGLRRNSIWWWEDLRAEATSIPYSGQEGLERLSKILPHKPAPVWLFATDDDPPPWPCIQAPTRALVEMLREQRFFEYFIVDPELKWIVFDTHHNMLIAVGEGLNLR